MQSFLNIERFININAHSNKNVNMVQLKYLVGSRILDKKFKSSHAKADPIMITLNDNGKVLNRMALIHAIVLLCL